MQKLKNNKARLKFTSSYKKKRVGITFQNSLLIRRTINYLVKGNDLGERYNSVVFFF